MAFLEINNVVKRYEDHTALAGVSMEVPKGCIYGLLGPNGAGKSTLIRIINRILAADEGTVTLNGKKMTDDDIAHIGYLPEERGLYKKMKVGDHIVYLGRLKGMTKADAVASMHWWLDRFDLKQWENKKVEALSKGMQQKVQFIGTVIHRPPLLIFDEPFSGFDPVNADQLKVEILALRDQGSTILFSTHNMSSVEEVCQQITLLNQAHVVLNGRVDEVKQQHKKNIIAVQTPDTIEQNPALFTILPPEPGKNQDTLIKLAPGVQMRDAIAWLNEHCLLTGVTEVLPSMHEIFVETVKSTKTAVNNE